jgi:hypothetical protein
MQAAGLARHGIAPTVALLKRSYPAPRPTEPSSDEPPDCLSWSDPHGAEVRLQESMILVDALRAAQRRPRALMLWSRQRIARGLIPLAVAS